MNRDFELDLNAYVDGELSHDQEAEIIEAMRDDPELAQEICQLGQLKAQLRIAYADPPQPRVRVMNRVGRSWPAIAAGAAMLAVGVLSGWVLHGGSTAGTPGGNRLVILDPDGRGRGQGAAREVLAGVR